MFSVQKDNIDGEEEVANVFSESWGGGGVGQWNFNRDTDIMSPTTTTGLQKQWLLVILVVPWLVHIYSYPSPWNKRHTVVYD